MSHWSEGIGHHLCSYQEQEPLSLDLCVIRT